MSLTEKERKLCVIRGK